mmetsp:Transcript_3801/g.13684  ORF Transcript_3801/g.13684 Transcript_3801/m.13684 type:complete len:186 (-) Transcript_3801:411-968(-)
MLTASVVLQLIFSLELLLALPSIQQQKQESCTNSGTLIDCVQPLCHIPSPLQIAALGVFIILMFNNVPNMYRHAQMALMTTRWKNGTGQIMQIEKPLGSRMIIFILGVWTEVVTFSAILISGSLFIITAKTVDLVIRSTVQVMLCCSLLSHVHDFVPQVAIMFVQNVDEVVFGLIPFLCVLVTNL